LVKNHKTSHDSELKTHNPSFVKEMVDMRLAPNVTFDMLNAAFWLDRAPNPDAPLLAPEQITAFNARVHDVLGIPPVLSLPDVLPCDEVVAQMRAGLPKRVLYDVKGQPLEPAVFEFRRAVPGRLPDRFGPFWISDAVLQRALFRRQKYLLLSHLTRLRPHSETTVDVGRR
jgi:hypothetical protein